MNHWVIAALFLAWVAVLLVSLWIFAFESRMDRKMRKALAEHVARRPEK
jgi:Na+/melibiose symporter-like transporter